MMCKRSVETLTEGETRGLKREDDTNSMESLHCEVKEVVKIKCVVSIFCLKLISPLNI